MNESIKDKLEDAKRLLRQAGYRVIPEEHVVTLETQKLVPLTDIHRVGNDAEFQRHVVRDMHVALGMHLMKATVLTVGEDAATCSRRMRLQVKVLHPCAVWNDPFAEEMMKRMREQGA